MANASADFGSAGVIQQIRDSILIIRDEARTAKEREDQSLLLVYYALSLHPALDVMRPPASAVGDLIWYNELRTPKTLSSFIFGSVQKNEHFRRLALLGETGLRSRIMLLLCWVLGHRLPNDRVRQLLSTAVSDGLLRSVNEEQTSMDHIQSLLSVRKVIEDLTRMVKTKLPLPPQRNPFYGEDFSALDEDKAIPHSDLWAYSLPPERRYDFDLKQNPSDLLRPSPTADMVLIPQTKLSLLAVQWATDEFGLGKKVHDIKQIEQNIFWNADPPTDPFYLELDTLNSMPYHLHTVQRFPSLQDDSPKDYQDALESWDIEKWIHVRFCRLYPVHDWAHDRLSRMILLGAFCRSQDLPTLEVVVTSIPVAAKLRSLLSDDIWNQIAAILMAENFQLWRTVAGTDPWPHPFLAMSSRQKSMALIFADAARIILTGRAFINSPPSFAEVVDFLLRPEELCHYDPAFSESPFGLTADKTAEDVSHRQLATNSLPSLRKEQCTCKLCSINEEATKHKGRCLHRVYPLYLTVAIERGCRALLNAWEPMWDRAETWLDSVLNRINSPLDLFSVRSPGRLGPCIVDVLDILEMELPNHHTPTKDLLRFVTELVTTLNQFAGGGGSVQSEIMDPLSAPMELPPDAIGYYSRILTRENDDDEHVRKSLTRTQAIITPDSGWLFELAGRVDDLRGNLTILCPSDNFRFAEYSMDPFHIMPICMPSMKWDVPILDVPQVHEAVGNDLFGHDPPLPLPEEETRITIRISTASHAGFPLLTVASAERKTEPECGAAELMTTYAGRLIQTWHRPWVNLGRSCGHVSQHRRATRCSLTSHNILLQVRYPNLRVPGAFAAFPIDPNERTGNRNHVDYVSNVLAEYRRRTARLTESGAPFAPQSLCIVRCGKLEGPPEPIVLLAGSLGKKVYAIHHRECWECAIMRMLAQGCTIGVATSTTLLTHCEVCNGNEELGRSVAEDNEKELETIAGGKKFVEEAISRCLDGLGTN